MFNLDRACIEYGVKNLVFRGEDFSNGILHISHHVNGVASLTTVEKPARYIEMVDYQEINRRVNMGELRAYLLDGDGFTRLH